MNVDDFLIKLASMTGVSGFETGVAGCIAEEFGKYCDDVDIDRVGNVIGHIKSKAVPSNKLMFTAHMDEIGLMVTNIGEKGFIGFTTLGGIDQRVLPAQEVVIHGRRDVFGVIGNKPPHLSTNDEMKKALKIEDMVIDTGYTADELKELVKVGDVIGLHRSSVRLQKNRLAGKSLDDMAGVAALLAAMDNLKDYKQTSDLYFVATVQEEIGSLGASTATYRINPDIGIAVDVHFAQTPGIADGDALEMGKGPGIAIGPSIHRKVYEKLVSCAKENRIGYQVHVQARPGGTEAADIQVSQSGVASGLLSIPLKYMHTTVETVSLDDIKETGRLISNFVISMNNCDMEAVLCY